jgi:hypothetical protein
LSYDYYEYPGYEDVRPHHGIRTETHKLMQYYTVDEWEMYDLSRDPEETTFMKFRNTRQLRST